MAPLECTIVVEGELDHRFGGAFEGLALTAGDGVTRLAGPLADQAQLQGLLRQLFDLGLVVVSFTTTPIPDPASTPDRG